MATKTKIVAAVEKVLSKLEVVDDSAVTGAAGWARKTSHSSMD